MLSVKASPTEERQVISDFMVAANASDYPRLETILASPHANPQQLLYIAFTQNLYTGIRMLTDRGVRLEAQTLTALLEVAVLRQMPVAQMEIFLQYSTAPINRDLLVAPFYKAMQMGRIDAIVFFLTKLPLLTHDFVGRHAGQALNQAELQKDALVIQQILKIGTAEFFRYFLTHYPKNMPHSDENKALFRAIASQHNKDSSELLKLLTEIGLIQAEKGVPLHKVIDTYPQWPLEEAPQVYWEMPYYPKGAYENPTGDRVIISDGQNGSPEFSLPIPPLLQKRRKRLVDIWTRPGQPANTAAATSNGRPYAYRPNPTVATAQTPHRPSMYVSHPSAPMALPSTIEDVLFGMSRIQHRQATQQARSTASDVANTSAVAATPHDPRCATLIEQPVNAQASAVAVVHDSCWAEHWAGTPHTISTPDGPVLLAHIPPSQNPQKPLLPLCPFGIGCPYESEQTHASLFAHVCPLPYDACSKLQDDRFHRVQCVHKHIEIPTLVDKDAAMAEHSRVKSDHRRRFNPLVLPPCPYMSQCQLINENGHAGRYSHPCQYGHKANCRLAEDARHNELCYHAEMLEQALSHQ